MRRYRLAALTVAVAFLGIGACDGSGPSDGITAGDVVVNDTAANDVVGGGDAPAPADTATSGNDTTAAEDTAAPDDTNVAQDTAAPQDTSVAQDTSVPEDTAVPQDTNVAQDTSVSQEGNGACQSPPVFGDITHITTLKIPTDATTYACDSNNDGTVDSKDGDINGLAAVAKLIGQDLNPLIAESLSEGSIHLGADLNGRATDPSDFFVNLYLGTGPPSDCDDVQETTSSGKVTATTWNGTMCPFEIDPDSFDEDGCPIITIPGAAMAGSTLSAGPTDFALSLPLGDVTLNVQVNNGRFSGTVANAFSLSNGHLCGEISKTNLQEALNNACPPESDAAVCGYKDMITTLLTCTGGGGTMCSVILDLASGQASEFTLGQ